jgi:hypothetical protein
VVDALGDPGLEEEQDQVRGSACCANGLTGISQNKPVRLPNLRPRALVHARGKKEAANRQQEERRARKRNRSEYPPHWALQRVTSMPRHSAHIPRTSGRRKRLTPQPATPSPKSSKRIYCLDAPPATRKIERSLAAKNNRLTSKQKAAQHREEAQLCPHNRRAQDSSSTHKEPPAAPTKVSRPQE